MIGPQAGYNAECTAPPASPTRYAGTIRTWRSTPTLPPASLREALRARPLLRAAGFEDSLPRRRLGEGGRTRTRTKRHHQSPSLLYHRRRGLSLKAQLGRFESVFLGHGSFSSVEAIKN
jgi:hypothetical protein